MGDVFIYVRVTYSLKKYPINLFLSKRFRIFIVYLSHIVMVGVIRSVSKKHIYFFYIRISRMCVYVCKRIRIYTWVTYTSSRTLVTYTHTHGHVYGSRIPPSFHPLEDIYIRSGKTRKIFLLYDDRCNGHSYYWYSIPYVFLYIENNKVTIIDHLT